MDDGAAGDLSGECVEAAVAGEVLIELSRLRCGVELKGPCEVEVGAGIDGRAGEAGVADVVVNDKDSAGGMHHPDAAVGESWRRP